MKLLADENLDNDILRGLEIRNPALDMVRVQDVGLAEAEDQKILEWAAENNRAVVSHDRRTLARFAAQRVEDGKRMPGVFIIRRKAPIRDPGGAGGKPSSFREPAEEIFQLRISC